MQERDLIVAVLAAQAGFVSPSQVLAAAAAGLVNSSSGSFLTWLENSGALNVERRRVLEALAEQAVAARNGDARAVLTSMGAAAVAIETLVSSVPEATGGSNGQTDDVPLPLEWPGQYTRLRELGRGSQSIVWSARDEIVGREVALKELVALTLPANDHSSRAARTRFLREVRLVAGLDHPGIVAIHDLARREDGTLFCAQKLVRGQNLQSKLATCTSLADRLGLVRHVLDACEAMGFAHSKHVIHRDLKPSNVMVGEYGETVVVDWGLAKHQEETDELVPQAPGPEEPTVTVAGVVLGTPAYMSPEQAKGDLPAIDARSDVFSLGAILYHVLTGRPPFSGATPDHVLENVRAGNFPPILALVPDAPPELAAIAERALRPDPSERYRDSEEMARELSTYLAGGRVRAYPYGPWELLRKFASSHRALLTGVSIAAAALLATSIFTAVRLQKTRVDLASSLRERAYRAEDDGDWSKAAAYFAASRVQDDKREARWGLAVAGERIPERVLSRQGPAGSFTDVTVLPDGRVIVLGLSSDRLEIREIESGRTLWTRSGGPFLGAAFLPGGLVRVSFGDGWVFHDAATGREVLRWPRSSGFPCPGAFPPRATILNGQVVQLIAGAAPRILATDVLDERRAEESSCGVSEDGRRLAYEDSTVKLHLLSLDDGRELAAPVNIYNGSWVGFSRHGLVVATAGRVDLIGGAEGNFSIELPEARSGTRPGTSAPGIIVLSPDGELVAIASVATEVVVVDLRSRTIRGILHHALGWPLMAFSPDGERVFAASLNGGSALNGWRLPGDDLPKRPLWFSRVSLSRSGRTGLQWETRSGRYELFKPVGTHLGPPVASGVHPLPLTTRLVGDGYAAAFITSDRSASVVYDLQKGVVLWEHPCRSCSDIAVSDDGSRLAQVGSDGLEVWDFRRDQRLFEEARRLGPANTQVTLSPDGRRVAWNAGDKVFVRDLVAGQELALALDGAPLGFSLSAEPGRVLTVSSRTISFRDCVTGRALWEVSNDLPDEVVPIFWSPDGRALLLAHGYSTTEVLDTASGERIAWFHALRRVVSPVRLEQYYPDLRMKGVAAEKTWDLRPLPQPDETPAAESLARTLRRTGLELRGVDLVAAP